MRYDVRLNFNFMKKYNRLKIKCIQSIVPTIVDLKQHEDFKIARMHAHT